LGAGTSTLGATTSVEVFGASAGGELTGTSAGGELTGTSADDELTGVTVGGVAAKWVVAGGVATGGVVVGAGAAALDGWDATMGHETGGVAVVALGDEAGGDEVGKATGAIDFGLEGVVAGDVINTFFKKINI